MFSRRILLAGVVFILLSLSQAFAADAQYQDKTGPVPWYYSPNKIVVKLKPELGTNINSFLHSDPAFDTTQAAEPN